MELLEDLKSKSDDKIDFLLFVKYFQDHVWPTLSAKKGTAVSEQSCTRPPTKSVVSSDSSSQGHRNLSLVSEGGRYHRHHVASEERRPLRTDVLDLSSLEQFPTVEASLSRRFNKAPRRITLTPVQSGVAQSGFPVPPGDTWRSSTSSSVFTEPEPVSLKSPPPLGEERRLLREERFRQRAKRTTTCGSQKRVDLCHHRPLPSSVEGKGSEVQPPYQKRLPPQLPASPSSVKLGDRAVLDQLAEVHAKVIQERLVPNITSELYLLVQMLTVTNTRHSEPRDGIFASVENCVYYAVAVLNKIRMFLTALDRPTLQLLEENPRVAEFCLELKTMLQDHLAKKEEIVGSSLERGHLGVPFREETDNSKNFPNMKSFHAFKKQRDSFYSIMREWSDKFEWGDAQSNLKERVRISFKNSVDLCSQSYFARLFLRQLVESCRFSFDDQELTSTVMGQFRNVDLQKFKRLNKRLTQPSSERGPCPSPGFTGMEEFFSGYVQAADSYVFAHHLKAVLFAELVKLHSKCSSVQPHDVAELLMTMRTLAKFLGYMEFLPYQHSPLPARDAVRWMVDVQQFLVEGCSRAHLCLTVPWLVEYLGMAAALLQLHSPLSSPLISTLLSIYRFLPLAMTENRSLKYGGFLILTSLGWLFENLSLSAKWFVESIKDSITGVHLESPGHVESQDLVTSELFYMCCPFLSEIRFVLSEYAAGLQSQPNRTLSAIYQRQRFEGCPIQQVRLDPRANNASTAKKRIVLETLLANPLIENIRYLQPKRRGQSRKIKPISTITDASENTAARKLKIQLEDSFFRGHPPYLKQVCEITSDRVSASATARVEATLQRAEVVEATRLLSGWLRDKCKEHSACGEEDAYLFNQVEAEGKRLQLTENALKSFFVKVEDFLLGHCNSQVEKALGALLVYTTAHKVKESAVKIAVQWSVEKSMKFFHSKSQASIHEEVAKGFEKLKRSAKSALKDGPSSVDVPPLSVPDGSPNEDSRSPLDAFQKVAEEILSISYQPPTDCLKSSVLSAITRVSECIRSQCCTVPGGSIPQLIPNGFEHLIKKSVQLASYLCSNGLLQLTLPPDHGESLLMALLDLWELTRGQKMEVPIECLLSSDAFATYISCSEKGLDVWQSLSSVLVGSVACGVSSSPVVEALWLCRWQQSHSPQLLQAAAVFLDLWYTFDCSAWNTVEMRGIHFVKLLSLVVEELPRTLVPKSLLEHSHLMQST